MNQLIEFVGLQDVATRRVGQFSLGMGQQLGIASALLGDPATLILDEPINGLDPDGIHWMRGLLMTLAAEGRTVFLSSHLMSEMALTADHLIIIGRGRLIRDISIGEFIRKSSKNIVFVRSRQAGELRGLLVAQGATTASEEPGVMDVEGLTAEQIGRIAAANGIVLSELTPQSASLKLLGSVTSLLATASPVAVGSDACAPAVRVPVCRPGGGITARCPAAACEPRAAPNSGPALVGATALMLAVNVAAWADADADVVAPLPARLLGPVASIATAMPRTMPMTATRRVTFDMVYSPVS